MLILDVGGNWGAFNNKTHGQQFKLAKQCKNNVCVPNVSPSNFPVINHLWTSLLAGLTNILYHTTNKNNGTIFPRAIDHIPLTTFTLQLPL